MPSTGLEISLRRSQMGESGLYHALLRSSRSTDDIYDAMSYALFQIRQSPARVLRAAGYTVTTGEPDE